MMHCSTPVNVHVVIVYVHVSPPPRKVLWMAPGGGAGGSLTNPVTCKLLCSIGFLCHLQYNIFDSILTLYCIIT